MKWWIFATVLLNQMLELKGLFRYPRNMFSRLTNFVCCLLLVLMPLQALATANMLICNSLMQSSDMQIEAIQHHSEVAQVSMKAMPCHQHMASKSAHKSQSKSSCKSLCANLCSNSCALTGVSGPINPSFNLKSTQVYIFNHQIYASIPQQNLQRPPILLA